MLCSNRHRRLGCGRTFAVTLACVLRRRVANTASLSTVWRAFAQGGSPSGTTEAGLTSRSRARLLAALGQAQHRVRTWLLSIEPPPASTDPRPLAGLWHHLLAAVGEAHCPLAALQLRTGQHLFG